MKLSHDYQAEQTNCAGIFILIKKATNKYRKKMNIISTLYIFIAVIELQIRNKIWKLTVQAFQ